MIVAATRAIVRVVLALAPGLPPVLPPSPSTTPATRLPPVLPPSSAPILTPSIEPTPAESSACDPLTNDRCCQGPDLSVADRIALRDRYRGHLEAADDEASARIPARGYYRCVEVVNRHERDLDEHLRLATEALDLPLTPALVADREVSQLRRAVRGRAMLLSNRAARDEFAAARGLYRRKHLGRAIASFLTASELFQRSASIADGPVTIDRLRLDAADSLHFAYVVAVEASALWAVCPTIRETDLRSPRLDLDRLLCDPPPLRPRERAALRARVEATAQGRALDLQTWTRALRLYHPQDLAGIAAGAGSLASIAGALTLRSRYHGNCYQPGGPPRCADDPDIPAKNAWAGAVVLSVLAGALAVTSATLLTERRIRRRSGRCAPLLAGSTRSIDGALTCRF